MKFKLSIFLLITILLISGGYLVWISYGQDIVDKYIITPSPTPDPYAGWKTYTNEEYGFSIKYPSEVKLSTQSNKNRESWTTLFIGSYVSKYQEVNQN